MLPVPAAETQLDRLSASQAAAVGTGEEVAGLKVVPVSCEPLGSSVRCAGTADAGSSSAASSVPVGSGAPLELEAVGAVLADVAGSAAPAAVPPLEEQAAVRPRAAVAQRATAAALGV